MSTHKANPEVREGRLAKANQFAAVAHEVLEAEVAAVELARGVLVGDVQVQVVEIHD